MFALILAGGQGERLRPLTVDIPKPMVPVCGRPVLNHQIDWLKNGGVTDVIFLAGYRWQAIQDYFGDGHRFGIQVHYSIESTPLGRGGAVKKGLSQVPELSGPIVVLNGDTITEEPLVTLTENHTKRLSVNPSHLITMMLVPFISPFRVVELDCDGGVLGFEENSRLPYWVNAGIYVMEKEIASELPMTGDHETLTYPSLAQRGQILGVTSTKFWVGIDSIKELTDAENYLKSRMK